MELILAQIDYDDNFINLIQWINGRDRNEEEFLMMEFLLPSTIAHFRTEGFCEEWLPSYLEYDFFQLFRMTRSSFHVLLGYLQCPEMNKDFTGGKILISSEKMLMMTLWWLGKGEVLLSVSDKFNISLSAVHRSLELVLQKIVCLKNRFIRWSDNSELDAIERDFQERAGYPGVIGAIDVCNIPFKAPVEQQESYIDRKLRHSIKLQGICVARKIFTNIMVGFPGSVHDSRVLQNCMIFQEVEINGNRARYFPLQGYHLLGDSAYPLLNWIMTPYRDNGNLTERQTRHNTIHSKTRIVIEHTFGLIKSRWRILKYINVNNVIKAVNIIVACCVLHNYCYINNDIWNEYEADENGDDEENGLNIHYNEPENKRNQIALLL